MHPQDEQSPGVAQPDLSNRCDGASWKERVESLSIDGVIEDDRAFKSMLGIGEDAYDSTKLLKIADNSLVTAIAGIGGGAVASSSVVAGAFFPTGGILGLLGLGTAVTPVGWVIVGAAAAGLGVASTRKLTRKMAGPVEVIPDFINSPIDMLAASLFDVMAPLVLKVSHADGECHDAERQRMREYFAESWGYKQEYVDLGLEYAEENLPGFETADVARAFAGLCKENRDCNFPAITLNIDEFLEELIAADGRVSEEEQRELDRIRQAFQEQEKITGKIWKQAAAAARSSAREKTGKFVDFLHDEVPRVAEDLAAAKRAVVERGTGLVRRGAFKLAQGSSVVSKTLGPVDNRVANQPRRCHFCRNARRNDGMSSRGKWQMNTDRTVLEGAMWARTRPMPPGKATDPGVTAADNRLFLEAVLWRIRTGSPWRDLPESFGKEAHLQALPQMGAFGCLRDCLQRAPG